MYLKLTNGVIEKYPYSIGELRRDNPQTSFPASPSKELLAEWGMFPVRSTPQPAHNELTTVLVEKQPVDDNGWKQVWEIENLPQDQAEANVRSERNRLIAESDWTQLDDTPVTNAKKLEWASYRQALRDIPNQAGFPWYVQWPKKP
jgi:hypothetical protein